MRLFSVKFLDELTAEARFNRRKRQHKNIHETYQDPCQRLFNAIEPSSYIRPHRHRTARKAETLIAVRGLLAMLTFDEQGKILDVIRFSSGSRGLVFAVGAEVPANTWHTVVALETGCVLLEIKAGPFDPDEAKDLAPWAPFEDSPSAVTYLQQLISYIEVN
jgi:cupin fold WbuC family metalloprotein